MSETTTATPTTDTTLPPTTTSEPDPTTTTPEPTTTTDPPTTTPPTTTPPTTTPPTTSEEETTASETETEPSETETTSETTSAPTSIPTTESTTSESTAETSSQLLTSFSTNDGETETIVVTPTDTGPTQSAISDNSSDGDSSFFDNKGAVAGVFTVVGLAALVLIIVVATNAIRRRRARKFDDEVAAAAAEANASTRYPFDDYDDPTPGRGGGAYGSYSDPESHGTLSQVPLTHHGESYNMSEFNGGYGPSYGAGAAGIGTLARRNTNTYGDVGAGTPGVPGYGVPQNSAHPVAPYNAFAGPINTMPSDPYDPYTAGNLGIKRQPSRGAADLLDAAGIGGAAAAGGAAVGAGAAAGLNRGPSQSTAEQAALDRQRSLGTERTLSPDNSNHSGNKTQESYAAHYQPDFRPNEHQYQPAGAPGGQPSGSSGEALPNPFARDGTDEDAYGADSFAPAGRHSPSHDDGRMSIRDEEDYGRAGRTLKVANE